MRRLICLLIGHKWIAVREDGMTIVGYPLSLPTQRYTVDPDGRHRACMRCGIARRTDDAMPDREQGK